MNSQSNANVNGVMNPLVKLVDVLKVRAEEGVNKLVETPIDSPQYKTILENTMTSFNLAGQIIRSFEGQKETVNFENSNSTTDKN